jgi:hypothetical protein
MTASKAVIFLSQLQSLSLASLPGAGVVTALLTAGGLGLLGLHRSAAVCFCRGLVNPVIRILHHVWATNGVVLLVLRCHNKFLVSSLWCIGEIESTETFSVRCQR